MLGNEPLRSIPIKLISWRDSSVSKVERAALRTGERREQLDFRDLFPSNMLLRAFLKPPRATNTKAPPAAGNRLACEETPCLIWKTDCRSPDPHQAFNEQLCGEARNP